jgi:arylsulfatase
MVLERQKTLSDPALHLTTPHIINLDVDPKELEPYNYPHLHTWTLAHIGKLLAEYQKSLGREPLIPAGAPLDYVPKRKEES